MKPFGLSLDGPTHIMGIMNATPDSFSDGGKLGPHNAASIAAGMIADGAAILDVGGESTRPGHQPVAAADELQRVVPVIRALRDSWDIPISVDTSKAAVAEAALRAGATFINDVKALEDDQMASVVANHGCGVVLMRHATLDEPVVAACRGQLDALVQRARAVLEPEQIMVDPGLGFGECPGARVEQNLALVDSLAEVRGSYPALVGHSRKRFVKELAAGQDLDVATADLSARAARAGAAVVRVHNVGLTARALQSLS